MKVPATRVAVFEENQTRGDLYSLWLGEYDVEVVATRAQADDVLDERVVVAVLDQEFADGEAAKMLDVVRSRAPLCRVIATRERSDAFPDLDLDHQLVKPVFEAELVDLVETLVYRANYHLALSLYYQTNVDLSSFEIRDGGPVTDAEEYDDLQRRASQLQSLIADLSQEMTREDITAVKREILLNSDVAPSDDVDKIDSKYLPGKCSQCGQGWDSGPGEEPNVTQLGAFVWRCVNCGHVEMRTDPSHQDIGSYRK